ncbi:PhnE/PtxC family ABC transporter permease [Natrinema gelatinilyticum]|uniref:PhnE/PtxC family ABC transporter permease n=1 Tax=Natrinema gelatinilyticum TaxID=2961571 RepID=UPI0020C5A531|nr:hypothetical protein [Natrinema gelatinilyticum]
MSIRSKAGALAIRIHNAGVLETVFADFFEDTDLLSAEAVYSTGATRLQTVVHGMVPQSRRRWCRTTLYR